VRKRGAGKKGKYFNDFFARKKKKRGNWFPQGVGGGEDPGKRLARKKKNTLETSWTRKKWPYLPKKNCNLLVLNGKRKTWGLKRENRTEIKLPRGGCSPVRREREGKSLA